MPLDTSRRPTLCSYKSITPTGGFTLQVSLSFGSILLGNVSLRMEDAENRLSTKPAPIGFDRLEGQRCKYAKKSYMYKYDLGHILLCVLMNVVVVILVQS